MQINLSVRKIIHYKTQLGSVEKNATPTPWSRDPASWVQFPARALGVASLATGPG